MFCLASLPCSLFADESITAIWANNGEDKVVQADCRATQGKPVVNSVWDGKTISIFGGRNEVVSFNVILEAGLRKAENVAVSFDLLKGPPGSAIASTKVAGDDVFDWTHRDIELFYIRYLPIQGISLVATPTFDERLIPQRMRRPWNARGVGAGSWQDRPDHDQAYPDIAVPLEIVSTFTIAARQSQSIWVDLYIPKTSEPGVYLGTFTVTEKGFTVGKIPVRLKVYPFTLPDEPSSKTMLVYSSANINRRYFGNAHVSANSADGVKARLLRDRHYLLAHRHRISLIGDSPADCDSNQDQPCPESLLRLNGDLFTAAHGYNGPGIRTGNDVYSIGTYSAWSWKNGTEADMHRHTDAWVSWFKQYSPHTDYFLYLIDESKNTAQIETWAKWILENPGPGRELKSLATIPLPTAAAECPSLDIPTSTLGWGIASQWEPLTNHRNRAARKRFYMYNGHRPGSGSFVIEDDGVALREVPWGQYKKNIDRWFYWNANYYNNYQGHMGDTNVFENAQTFGTFSRIDTVLGKTGWNYGNGDGVLFYPGTDKIYPNESYGIDGPFASLRLKYWRRGIQDVEYLTMASHVNFAAVQAIVQRMIPRVLWECGAITNPRDPTYHPPEISWPIDPDIWENARAQLAEIISGHK